MTWSVLCAADRRLKLTSIAKSYYSEEDIVLALDAQGTFLDMASRWGLFQWKLQHAAQSMALQDWDQCFALVRSAQHDAVAMVALLDDAADGIRSYLVCEKVRKPQLLPWKKQ